MNAIRIPRKLIRVCKRFVNTEAKCQDRPQWIRPVGHQTEISIYNPITKCKVPLILKTENILKWYICGPTVYDSAHIGHATTYIKSDIIRRILSDYFNMDVLLVMGITDIDDKIIKRSFESEKDFETLSRHFETEFFADMNKLNISEPYLRCRVTDYIPQIIQFIERLIAKDDGYVASDGSVYFNTSKYNKYGKLSTPVFDTVDDQNFIGKKSALDFALWKAVKKNEPSWKSPWGYGRPGWHIECSAIASTVFGNSIDMHSGGIDLAFPHHENEEAQSCCYHSVDQWVNYWLHCGHLSLKGNAKMSKSLKNTISIQDYLENYSANHLRMLCLLSHYRNGIEFSDEVMQTAVSVTKKLDNFINDCDNYVVGNFKTGEIDENLLYTTLHNTRSTVYSALADDFDTSKAMHAIINLVGIGNKMLHQDNVISYSNNVSVVAAVSKYLSNTLSKFGISRSTKSTVENGQIKDIVDHFLNFRTVVRIRALEQNPKDTILLKECDNVRKCLSTCGITVKDQQNSTSWSWKQ
ncbi:PREDICTED: probable cysteine--tRNA ligase, mitochondrial [Cyphomyrmex costatus]|uniref:cysteine--tRNA ligase n=1 Tax=Cyphomyrmex costatus TaxID=456900 RepID=A0A195CT17_9HYME|nr:PREDICTED: probable cysteine--tRNA ligase, mitochondrial [Cyphomyrmex costatus]KYN03790.1 Cysteinyl-tRNA synthetase, mitochondrial [Cyphomyrmex costatus]